MENTSRSRAPYKIFNAIMRSFRSPASENLISIRHEAIISELNTRSNLKVLEIGSRNVSGNIRKGLFKSASEYVGFDYHPGENVDIVGDAHNLSKHVPNDHFDVVYSVSVFEHLMFPWKVALEINRVLKTGGIVITGTHPAWPEHEMPWDFWRFPRNAFITLFNPITGFEIMESIEGSPMRAFPLSDDAPMQLMFRYHLNGAVFCVARKIADYDQSRLRWDLDASDVTATVYPSPK